MVTAEFLVSGTVDEWTSDILDTICDAFANAIKVDPCHVECFILAASVKLYTITTIPAGLTAADITSEVSATVGDQSLASFVLGITVEAPPFVDSTTANIAKAAVAEAAVSTYDEAFSSGLGLAVGVLVAAIVVPTVACLCLLAALVYCYIKRFKPSPPRILPTEASAKAARTVVTGASAKVRTVATGAMRSIALFSRSSAQTHSPHGTPGPGGG